MVLVRVFVFWGELVLVRFLDGVVVLVEADFLLVLVCFLDCLKYGESIGTKYVPLHKGSTTTLCFRH